MSASPGLSSENQFNKCISKAADSDVWQQILACDTKFCNIRPILKDNPKLKQMYLRRRMELFKEMSIGRTCASDDKRDSSSSRGKYSSIREQLLVSLYGSFFPERLPSLQNFEPFKVRSVDGGFIHCSSLNYPLTEVLHTKPSSKLGQESNVLAVLGENYTFSGIQHIFDHHSAAVNRLRFAHKDNTRLAMASSDGTISICRTWPPEEPMRVQHVLTGGHSGSAAVTDVAWSLANDFLVSTAMDGSVCLWDMEKAVLTRVYSAASIGVGPVLVCLFQPLNFNLLVVGGAWGSVQTLNLSTGKAVRKGRDQLHSTRFSRHYQPNSTSQVTCHDQGCVTALEFEDARGTCLWVGTDRGIIQSYIVQPGNGHMVRAKRHNLALTLPPHMWLHATSSAPERTVHSHSFRKVSTINELLRRKSQQLRAHSTHTSDLSSHAYTFPCISSLSMHSWLSNDAHDSFLLVRVADYGLLLFRVISTKSFTTLSLERTFPVLHGPESVVPGRPTMRKNPRLMHSCFAPLLSSYRCGAYAMTGGLDGNVHVYNVLAKKDSDYSASLKSVSNGLVTTLQGHLAPVLDVAIGWDENVLASADELGIVIIWRRGATGESV